MLAIIPSAVVLGVDGIPVRVEVHVSNGLPGFTVVGLPDASCREARDRVRAALLSTGGSWPQRRVTVNLAPSGVRKVGSGLDLAIAVGVLAADEQLPVTALAGFAFIGELGLDGRVRPVPGVLPLVHAVRAARVVVPAANFHEATLAEARDLLGVASLAQVVEALRGGRDWPAPPPPAPPRPAGPATDLSEVRGQPLVRRALEVAAAGGHHLLMVGPPGAGKTMLAERLPSLLPPLEPGTALDLVRVRSAAGVDLGDGLPTQPPLRAPHHSLSSVALIGGGSGRLRPGELSLAHGGVLFLDELSEFPAGVLDALRTPLEQGVVRVARADARVTLPAAVLLVGAMNPCPCGSAGGPGSCRCTPAQLASHRRRLSGPLLDRFDLRLTVAPPGPDELLAGPAGECSAVVAERVAQARRRAVGRGVSHNASLGPSQLEGCTELTASATALLHREVRLGRLSARGLRRLRAVVLTLADLDGAVPPFGETLVRTALALRVDPFPAVAA